MEERDLLQCVGAHAEHIGCMGSAILHDSSHLGIGNRSTKQRRSLCYTVLVSQGEGIADWCYDRVEAQNGLNSVNEYP